MSIYKENEDKLNLNVSDTEQPVKITVDTYSGTGVSVVFKNEIFKFVHGGETIEVGKATELKGNSIEFRGSAYNPDGDQIKITHTIFENDDNPLIYTFPDDYTGANNYDNSDENPTYVFFITFN